MLKRGFFSGGMCGSWDAAPLPVENIHRLAINLYSELLIRWGIAHGQHVLLTRSILRDITNDDTNEYEH